MITKSQHLLLKLLQNALWHSEDKPIVRQEYFEQVMFEATQQAVGALVADCIINSGVRLDVKAVAQLLSTVQQHVQKATYMDAGVAQLAQLLDANGIRYVVFKGQVAAVNYLNPALRTSGDIDFYVAKDDFSRASEVIAAEWKVEIERVEGDHHWNFSHEGIEYEMHYRAEMFGTKSHQLYFDSMVETDVMDGCRTVIIGGTAVRAFSKELELLHVFKHFFYHLLVEGVGLRQLCDIFIMLNAYDDINKPLLRKYLLNLGYARAFDATVCMAQRYLGLKETAWTIKSRSVEKYADRIMDEILEGGNFGRRNRRYNKMGMRKSMETAVTAFHHVRSYLLLAPSEVFALSLLRIRISTRNIIKRYNRKSKF